MFKNILLPYDFENDFKNVPEQLQKLTDNNSTVIIYNVVTNSDLAINIKYYGQHKNDIINKKEIELSPFLQELNKRNINYKIETEFGQIKKTILEKINCEKENKDEIDLVVMSNARINLDIKQVLGDVTHKVAKRSLVPVLIVK